MKIESVKRQANCKSINMEHNGITRAITAHVLLVNKMIGWSPLVAFDFSSDLQFSLTGCSSHHVSRLSKRTDFITTCVCGCFVGAKLPLVLLFLRDNVFRQHAEACRICSNAVQDLCMYCSSTRSTAPTYQCSDYETELIVCMVFGINTWVDYVATHPTSICYACCKVIERYHTAMRLGKIFRHLANVFDG